MSKRKIIQLEVFPGNETNYGAIYVLCDDGSVWRNIIKGLVDWEEYDCKQVTDVEDEENADE